MFSFEDEILIKNRGNVKVFFARKLQKKFPNKADILNTSYKNCSLAAHTDSVFC